MARFCTASTPGTANGGGQDGDLDGDGNCDAADLAPFVTVLLDPTADPMLAHLADINCDGAADGRDIQPFVDVIIGA